MVKRELATEQEIEVDAPRSKRHRDSDVAPSTKDGDDDPEKGASSDLEDENGVDVAEAAPSMSSEEVQEEGLKVWQVLKDTVNKEGRQISYDFLRLPSKRQFPDYYEIIKQPIALDDIKTKLENYAYPSLETLREDLDTCFKNAKRYNLRESVIWRDAKTLQKLANKEIDKIIRKGNEDDEGSDKEGGKKKEKGVNIHRLMKNRLLKLVEKADDSGRRLSDAFMELPSKKKWAVYYKLIQRPICIEDIFKRIKRKEYYTIPDFMNDVDRVFDNAMTFNEENSPIWVDALTLKTYFHQIMTALPAKYNMNGADAHSSASPEVPHNKIKLKLPGHQAAAHSGSADVTGGAEASTSTVRLRVPGHGGSGSSGGATANNDIKASVTPVKKGKATSPIALAKSLPSAASISYSNRDTTSSVTPATAVPTPTLAMPTPKPAKAMASVHLKPVASMQTPSQQQQPSTHTPFHQYSATSHIPPPNFYSPAAQTPTPARGSVAPAPSVPQPVATTGRTDAPSPVPPVSAAGLYSVRLECCPPGNSNMRRRLAILDSQAGVRNFAIRVPIAEAKVIIRLVKFTLQDNDGAEGSDAEEEAKVIQTPKKRGRGRPKRVVPIDQEVKPPDVRPERSSPAPVHSANEAEKSRGWLFAPSSEVEVKLDSQEVSSSTKNKPAEPPVMVNGNGKLSKEGASPGSTAKPEDEWIVSVTSGQHILEIGRTGNNVPWRVYLTVS